MLKVVILSVFILSFVYNTIAFYEPGSSLFSWHPTFMVAGQLLILEGVFLMKHIPYKWRVTIHWLLAGTGASSFALGFLVIYQNKKNNNKSHFTSWHAYSGVTLLSLMGLQVAGGILVKYSKLLKQNTKYLRAAHKLSGFLVILISFITVLLVTQESKMYFCTVALPSAVLLGVSGIQSKTGGMFKPSNKITREGATETKSQPKVFSNEVKHSS